MKLSCPTCGGQFLKETKLDRYDDVIYRKLTCCDCGCSFAAKYILEGVVKGSVRTGECWGIGAQIVRHMFAFAERTVQ